MAIDFSSSGVFSTGSSPTTQLTMNSSGGLSTPNTPAFYGEFASQVASNYNPTLTGTTRNVVLTSASSRITVPIAGWYHIYCQQLCTTSGGVYLNIVTNSGTQTPVYAYSDNDSVYDMVAACDVYLNANDYIYFYYTGTVTQSYGGRHSSVMLYLIG